MEVSLKLKKRGQESECLSALGDRRGHREGGECLMGKRW